MVVAAGQGIAQGRNVPKTTKEKTEDKTMQPELLRRNDRGLFEEQSYSSIISKLDNIPIKPLSTWYMILNRTTNEVVYRTTKEGRRNSAWFKKYWKDSRFVRTEYTTHKRDLLKSKQLHQWNNGFTHQPLNYVQADMELSYTKVIWQWEETLTERKASVAAEKEKYRLAEMAILSA